MGDFVEHRRADDPRFTSIENKLSELSSKVDTLHEAFTQAKGAITFIKWMAAVVAAGAATWAWIVSQINITPRI